MLPRASIEWTAEPNGIRFHATITTRIRAEIFVCDPQVIPGGPARGRRSPLWARETPPCHSALLASDTTGDRAAMRVPGWSCVGSTDIGGPDGMWSLVAVDGVGGPAPTGP